MGLIRASDVLKSYEVDLMLAWFMYTMSQERRENFMAEFPVIYSKLTGMDLEVYDGITFSRKFVSTRQKD